MPLDDNDRLILMANALYDSIEEKLRYINYKHGVLLPDGSIDPLKKSRAMAQATYYRKLKKIGEGTTERMLLIAKHFQDDALNQHELIKKLEKDKLQMLELCRAKKDYGGANRIGDSVIALQPYLSAIKESIKDILENDIGSTFKAYVPPIETSKKTSGTEGQRVLGKASRTRKTVST